jgi:retinol dehydrogenase-12
VHWLRIQLVMELAVFVVSSSSVVYSLALAVFRHMWHEDRGIVDSVINLAVATVPCALMYLTHNTIALIIAPILSLVLSNRMYQKYVSGPMFIQQDLTGKVFIITGSNTGIGYDTALEIARMNGTLILACRTPEKANAARDSIIKTIGCSPSKVIVLPLDLCDFVSVRNFVKLFLELSLPLYCLINNAGVMVPDRTTTKMGYEMMMHSNHLSHFLLTLLLLPSIKATKGRIINVSSSTHHFCKRINFEDFHSEKSFSLFCAYSTSKLANILFTFELQRR